LLLQLFKKSYFIQISWVVFFAIILAIPGFFFQNIGIWPNNTLFFQLVQPPAFLLINWVNQLLFFFLILFLSFYLKVVLTKHHLVHHLNFIPSLLVILLFNFYHEGQFQLIGGINLFLLILAFSHLLESFDNDKPDNNIFSAAFLISIATLLSYTNLVFILIVWLSFFVFQNYSWRYFPITIVGIITPYFFFLTWLFWEDKLMSIENEWYLIIQTIYEIPLFDSLFHIVITSILGFFIFLSLAKIIPETPGKIIAIRKKTSLSLYYLVLSIFPFLFSQDIIVKNIILIPLAGIMGYYLRAVKARRRWIDLLFTIFVILIIGHQYYSLYVT
jgi:hypothetical protein